MLLHSLSTLWKWELTMKFRERDWTLVVERMGPAAPKMDRIAAHVPDSLISVTKGEGGKRIWTFGCNLVIGERGLPALIDLSPSEVIRTSRPWKIFIHKDSGFCCSSFDEQPVAGLRAENRPIQGAVQIHVSDNDGSGPRSLRRLLWWEERDTLFCIEWHTPEMIMPAKWHETDNGGYWEQDIPTVEQVRRLTTPFFRFLASRGITHFRTGPYWSSLQGGDAPNDDFDQDMMDIYVEVLRTAKPFGVHGLCGLGDPVWWAKPTDPYGQSYTTSGIDKNCYRHFIAYLNFVLENVAQGPDPLLEDFLEILNEPNLASFWHGVNTGGDAWQFIDTVRGGSSEDSFGKYVDLLAQSYAAIRGDTGDGYGHLTICNGGLFSSWRTRDHAEQGNNEVYLIRALEMLRDMEGANEKPAKIFDAIAIHTYGLEYTKGSSMEDPDRDKQKDPIGPKRQDAVVIGSDDTIPTGGDSMMDLPPVWSDSEVQDEMHEYIRGSPILSETNSAIWRSYVTNSATARY